MGVNAGKVYWAFERIDLDAEELMRIAPRWEDFFRWRITRISAGRPYPDPLRQ